MNLASIQTSFRNNLFFDRGLSNLANARYAKLRKNILWVQHVPLFSTKDVKIELTEKFLKWYK